MHYIHNSLRSTAKCEVSIPIFSKQFIVSTLTLLLLLSVNIFYFTYVSDICAKNSNLKYPFFLQFLFFSSCRFGSEACVIYSTTVLQIQLISPFLTLLFFYIIQFAILLVLLFFQAFPGLIERCLSVCISTFYSIASYKNKYLPN